MGAMSPSNLPVFRTGIAGALHQAYLLVLLFACFLYLFKCILGMEFKFLGLLGKYFTDWGTLNIFKPKEDKRRIVFLFSHLLPKQKAQPLDEN